jgi:glutamate formiminotransferase
VNDIERVAAPQAGSDGDATPAAAERQLLSVPNVSEGADPDIIAALDDACRRPGTTVLDRHSDVDHNRTVFSLAGTPASLTSSLVGLATAAARWIDIRRQQGAHPRTGALDVVPIVVLDPNDFPDARATAMAVADGIAYNLEIPVFYYGQIATRPELMRPYGLRRHGSDALAAMVADGTLRPDVGPARLHPTAGCVLVGVRPPLIAWNVWLPEASLAEARAIADRVRESGGGLPGVRAMGLYLPHAGIAQVSLNLEDSRSAPPGGVRQAVRREADRLGVELGASELVGLMPRAALGGVDPAELGLEEFRPSQLLEVSCPALARDQN